MIEIAAALAVIIQSIVYTLQTAKQNRIFERQNEIIAAQGGIAMRPDITEIGRLRRYRPVLLSAAMSVIVWVGIGYLAFVTKRYVEAVCLFVGASGILVWIIIRTQAQLTRAKELITKSEESMQAARGQLEFAIANLPQIENVELFASFIHTLIGNLTSMRSSARGTHPSAMPHELEHPLSEKIFDLPIKEWRGYPVDVYVWRRAFDYLRNKINCLYEEIPETYSERTADDILKTLTALMDRQLSKARELRDACEKEGVYAALLASYSASHAVTKSDTSQSRSVMPAAIAGVVRRVTMYLDEVIRKVS